MHLRTYAFATLAAVLPCTAAAQAKPATAAASTSPVADAFRQQEARYARILVAAAEAMPAEKYNYRPTPAQMSFAEIQVHLANEGNDELCGKLTGSTCPSGRRSTRRPRKSSSSPG